ncbi:MAG: MOSC domain-containing protein [Verrucomicrobia bacterium]|nr:MOSC domain-containing protein [Verrucomicrobiota bacterium]
METFCNAAELAAGLAEIEHSPATNGVLRAIAIRPEKEERLSLTSCELSAEGGAHGDHWAKGCWLSLPDGRPHPDAQLTLMNSRCIALIARDESRWPLAGDNLFVDLDLSCKNLSPGDRLQIGPVILEITPQAHNGCAKFARRFGTAALQFVNSPEGKAQRLRGIYARVVQPGKISVGDAVVKL